MTLQNEMLLAARDCETYIDCRNKAVYFGERIRNTDPSFWGIEKRFVWYGTYQVYINFANEYHFGRRLAEALKKDTGCIVIHDKNKPITLNDFEDKIDDVCFDIISDEMERLELTSRPPDYR